MPQITPEEQKEIIKQAFREAIQEWLDKQFAAFGRWTFYGILSVALSIVAYVWFHLGFWKNVR